MIVLGYRPPMKHAFLSSRISSQTWRLGGQKVWKSVADQKKNIRLLDSRWFFFYVHISFGAINVALNQTGCRRSFTSRHWESKRAFKIVRRRKKTIVVFEYPSKTHLLPRIMSTWEILKWSYNTDDWLTWWFAVCLYRLSMIIKPGEPFQPEMTNVAVQCPFNQQMMLSLAVYPFCVNWLTVLLCCCSIEGIQVTRLDLCCSYSNCSLIWISVSLSSKRWILTELVIVFWNSGVASSLMD